MLFKSLGAAALAASSLLLPAATTTQSTPPSRGGSVASAQNMLRSVIRDRTSAVNTGRRTGTRASSSAHIPPGQLPPAGMCRVWIDGVPPGHQPAVTDCATAQIDAARTANARVIYGDQQSFPGRGKYKVKRRGDDNDNSQDARGGNDDDDDDDRGTSASGGVLGGVLGPTTGSTTRTRTRGSRPSWVQSNAGSRGHGRGHGRD